MKKTFTIIVGIMILLLGVSCSYFSPEKPAEEPAPVVETPKPALIQGSVVAAPRLSNEIADLLSKNRDTTNLYYVFDASDAEGYEIYWSGSKIKKVYTDPLKFQGNIYYNILYINHKTKTAYALCDQGTWRCDALRNKALRLQYEQEKSNYRTPVELVQDIVSATKIGSEVFQNRAATLIEYTARGPERGKLSIDNYYGLPLRQLIYGANEEITEQHTFTRMSVGQVREAEVTFPSGYIFVS